LAGPTPTLEVLEKKAISCPCQESNFTVQALVQSLHQLCYPGSTSSINLSGSNQH